MKSIIFYKLLSRFGVLFLSTVLTLTALSARSTPPPNQQDKIAEKIQVLQESKEHWIQINLSQQRLIAWEGGKPVYAIIISTGKRSTPTRTGTFEIASKHRLERMRGDNYDVSDVPYTMYYSGSYAIHGTYWHRKFGTPVSHGCINVAVNHAKWLFNWASVGTPVVVHE